MEQSQQKMCYANSLANIYEIYISGDITEPENYIEQLALLRSAGANDVVKIYINSTGGILDTAIQFRKAIQESEAHIIASNESACASAATIIFLSADEFELAKHSFMMIHDYSSGTYGKGSDMHNQIIFQKLWFASLVKDVYNVFLTDEEIESVINGREIWLDSDEIAHRCKAIIHKWDELSNQTEEE